MGLTAILASFVEKIQSNPLFPHEFQKNAGNVEMLKFFENFSPYFIFCTL